MIGAPQDGIPAIEQPQFATASNISYMDDDDLVLGLQMGNTIHGYPHPILDYHEIINDELEGHKVAVTYCPFTGTGIGWDRMVNGSPATFRVSGMLYNANLMPFDKETGSVWSQMRLDCVYGTHVGQKTRNY